MENCRKRATLLRNDQGEIIMDKQRFIFCVSEDGLRIRIPSTTINWEASSITLKIGNEIWDVSLNYVGSETDTLRTPVQEIDRNSIISIENAHNVSAHSDVSEASPGQYFVWTDRATKIFLALYKEKKELVTSRKVKSMKVMWKHISEELVKEGINISATQAENKFKTLERAYKAMVRENKKTGRGRTTCKYENELTELLGHKHSITPLAVSGKKGLVLRSDAPLSGAQESSTALDLSLQRSPPNPSPSTQVTPCSDIDAGEVAECTTKRKEKRKNTAKSLANVQKVIEDFTEEIKKQRADREKVNKEILEEQKKMFALYSEHLVLANQHRENKNKLLKEVLDSIKSKETATLQNQGAK